MNRKYIIQRLHKQGLRITPQRIAVLQIVMESHQPITAQQTLSKVRENHPNISLDTVYRTLTLLAELGIVSQINLQNREISRFEFQKEGEHHHHVVCLSCGKFFCIPMCPIASFPPPSDDPGFQVVTHALETYGYCSKCQNSPKDSP